MTEPRYTPEDFVTTHFAAIRNEDGTYQYFLKAFYPFWTSGEGSSYSLTRLIERGAFPVFPEPYSLEALQFAWEHAEGTEGNPEFVREVPFKGTAAYKSNSGGIIVTSAPRGTYLGPTERILHQKPVRKTPAEKIAELLEKEVPGLPEDSIENVSAAIADRADDLINIFEE